MIAKCPTCFDKTEAQRSLADKYQDKKYGLGFRVHTESGNPKNPKVGCTTCGTVKQP